MGARLSNRRDKAFSLILGPSGSRDLRGFCLFIYPITFLTIDKRNRSNTMPRSVFTEVRNYGFLETF
jgi:hypothetical protein